MPSCTETPLHAFHTQFRQFEDELNVFSLMAEGIPVWERIRLPVAVELKQKTGVYETRPRQHANSRQRYLSAFSLLLKNIVIRNPLFAKEHNVLFWGHQRRKQQDNGMWWDIYCDPIYESLDIDYIHFEVEHRFQHHRPAKTTNLRYLDLIKFGSALLLEAGIGACNLPNDVRERLFELEQAIQIRFGVEIDLCERVRRIISLNLLTGKMYDWMLKRVNPDVVVIVVSYGKEAFIEACQRQGIPVVELQHGVINKYHYGYDFPPNHPKDAFPNYIFTFGPHWTKEANFPIPDKNIIPVGFPYLEKQREAVSDIETKNQLLFISSGYSSGRQFSRIAVDAANQLDSEIVYKLHPNEYDNWKTQYPWLIKSKVQVIDTDKPSLYKLFAESKGQVGVCSTALFEGITFGLPTFVVELPCVEYFQTSIELGDVVPVPTVEALIEKVQANQAPKSDGRRYFIEDPLPRIDSAIKKVIEEN